MYLFFLSYDDFIVDINYNLILVHDEIKEINRWK